MNLFGVIMNLFGVLMNLFGVIMNLLTLLILFPRVAQCAQIEWGKQIYSKYSLCARAQIGQQNIYGLDSSRSDYESIRSAYESIWSDYESTHTTHPIRTCSVVCTNRVG